MVLHHRTELVRLTEAAVAVALSVLLGSMRLVELPQGGSVALASLPILALALARGSRTAIAAGACAGAAHAGMGGTIIHPVQLLLDYVFAYAALGIAGVGGAVASRDRMAIAPRVLVAMCLHLACVVTSGMVFFAPAAGHAAFAYSLTYNASTVVPETVLAIWLLPAVLLAMARANPSDAWRRGLLEPGPGRARTPRSIHAPASIDIPVVSPAPAPRTTRVQPAQAPTALVRTAPFDRRPAFSTLRLTRSAADG